MTSYIPSSKKETADMLEFLGRKNIYELIDLPKDLISKKQADIPEGISEMELEKTLQKTGAMNTRYDTVFRGAGAYRHFIPAVVDNIASQNEFVSAYTPYQAEISQGLLCAIFEYQSQMCALSGMDVSNASLYDGAYSAAEAVMMCRDTGKRKVILPETINPRIADTIKAYCSPAGFVFETAGQKNGVTDIEALENKIDGDTACVLIQSPNYLGIIEDIKAIGEIIKSKNARYIISGNPLSMAIYLTPGEAGADIAVGDAQPLGIPLSFGGPYIGFLCSDKKRMRSMGGRIVGQTTDRNGKRAFVLTLQAREQHIRRENAKSAICSNQALCALRVSAYLSAMGPQGLKDVATLSRGNAAYLKRELLKTGIFKEGFAGEHFNEFTTTCPENYCAIQKHLKQHKILGGLKIDFSGEKYVLWCATELTGKEETGRLISIIKEASA